MEPRPAIEEHSPNSTTQADVSAPALAVGTLVKPRRTKTRAGCRTCKIRRLKCDLARPACSRCTTTGRSCDGYGPLAIPSLPFDIPGNNEERRSFHYFRLQTSTAILGSQDSNYWTASLLQLCYSQPAIKDALIAMASLHEALDRTDWYLQANDNDQGRRLRLFSWAQYNSAIQQILRDTSTDRMPLEILIVLCLLFNQYDNFQANYSAAYMHIKMGLKLIEEWSAKQADTKATPGSTATITEMVKNHAAPMLCRLDVQAAFLMHSEAHTPPYDELTKTHPPIIPRNFRNFSQARKLFDHATSFMFHALGKKPDDCNHEGTAHAHVVLETWSSAFSELVTCTPTREGDSNDRAIRLLRVYYNFARIVLDTHHSGDKMPFDKQTDCFELMIEHAKALIELPSVASSNAAQPFSFDVSLASPLNFVGARCRDPEVRRKAIALLKTAEKSSWNCEHCALVVQFILDTEEQGTVAVRRCEDIPSERRIRRIMTEVCFDEEVIRVTYVRHPYTDEMPVEVAVLPLRQPGGIVVAAEASGLKRQVSNQK